MNKTKIASLIASVLIATQLNSVYAIEATKVVTNIENNESIENNDEDKNSKIDINGLNNSLGVESYVVIDSKTGDVIMEKNKDKVMYPASLTKILTSLLLVESGKLDDMFTVSKAASEVGESSMNAKEGEKVSGKDLLYAMMLQSANDATYVVGEGISGSIDNFYVLMNQKAKELGLNSSNFSSSSGLHKDDHVSTAYDLAIITKEALKYNEFREVMGVKEHKLTRTSENTLTNVTNKNRMMFDFKSEYNKFVIGGKTAFTTPAGNCLMEIATKDGMEVVIVTLKSATIYEDTNKIINFTFDNFKSNSITEKGDFAHQYKGRFLKLYTKEGIGYVTKAGVTLSKSSFKKETIINNLPNKIPKNYKVGKIVTFVDGKEYKSVDIYSKEEYNLEENPTTNFLKNTILFSGGLVLIKVVINLYKMRRAKTRGYLKNSKFY